MQEIWSKNKYINLIINILLFLVSINFFHYGQLLLPIICILLFIDNNYSFKINNIKIFIILCLFSVSFFIFSYEQGFYSVMGFCLPMAYYIGSNIKVASESNIKKVIYLISLGMMAHIILNFIVDFSINGSHLFNSSTHYDIWIPGKVTSSATILNAIFTIGSIYYILFYEKNIRLKLIFIFLLLLVIIYNFGLGQRTLYLMIAIAFITGCISDYLIFNKKKISNKVLLACFVILGILILVVLLFSLVPELRESVKNIRIFAKFFYYGIGSNRLDIFMKSIRLMPKYIFGGNRISEIVGVMPHDLWLDVYNWSGIIPFLLLIAHTIMFFRVFIDVVKNNCITNDMKIMLCPLFLCLFVQLLMEPIMSGASLFLIVIILLESIIERMPKND